MPAGGATMKNNRILKLVFICLITVAVLSLTPQGGTRPAAAQVIGACAVYGPLQPGLQCPAWYRTGGCWYCYFSYVVCDEWECCCFYTPSINDGRVCPQYCY
jgi:hypothetical protein